MKKTSLLKAMKLCSRYKKMSEVKQENVRDERLHEIVLWAKENSPYYAELYKSIGYDFRLSDLPPVNKIGLMAQFDDWVTDSEAKLTNINEFMRNNDNIGRKFMGKYLVFTTSGSTGNPLVMLCDETANNIMGAINAGRTFTRKEDLLAFFMRGGRTIGVFATGGFYLGNSSVRARLLAMPWKKRQIAVTSALLPVPQIVKQLNEFQPAMLGGYPSNLELLIDEQKSGQLHIHPVLIMTGGEYLSDALRKKLSDAFKCYVQTSYSCTEGGTLACECSEHNFHVNDDWILIEPVDKDNNPVPDGVQSDKILLTNLFNYVQPIIRYEVTDRVIMHHGPCACGNPSPWLTLEGRTDDVLTFVENGKEVRLAPLPIYATLKELHELRRFQVIAHKENKIELRLEPLDGIDKIQVFEKSKDALKAFLKIHGVMNVEISLSDEQPRQHDKSGKFKHIINMINS